MSLQKNLSRRRRKAKQRVRRKINGTSEIPRLSVYKSGSHIYAQVINDEEHKTIVSSSTIDKNVSGSITSEMNKSDKAKIVGKTLGERAIEAGIKKVAFDRNGFIYTGRIKALADAAREAGLEF